MDIITKQQQSYEDVYIAAMKKCDELRDSESLKNIMNLLISSNIKPTINAFVIIDCMSRYDNPHLCIDFYNTMINKYKITPNKDLTHCSDHSCLNQI